MSAIEYQQSDAQERRGLALRPPHEGTQSRGDFVEVRGFHDVVVGVAVEPGDPFLHGITGGEDAVPHHGCEESVRRWHAIGVGPRRHSRRGALASSSIANHGHHVARDDAA